MKILLITPPLTQLNTPYPATAYLKGFLQSKGVIVYQTDLGIELVTRLFTAEMLERVFNAAEPLLQRKSTKNIRQIFAMQFLYIRTIDAVMCFLRGEDPTLATRICNGNFLPRASRFENLADLEWTFGTMGFTDRARHLATLYLEDLTDFIHETIAPNFELGRYAEHLSQYAPEFDPLENELRKPLNLTDELMLNILEENVSKYLPNIVGFSIPFPGNLYGALKCGQYLKHQYPKVQIAWGGGYVSTELRQLNEPKVFDYVDYVLLDDGEAGLEALIKSLSSAKLNESLLIKTFVRTLEQKVVLMGGEKSSQIPFEETGTLDYSGLTLGNYISLIELANPMHKLWGDGRWNKVTLAHGCYWAKCAFCDTSLPYIECYDPASATHTVDRMEDIMHQTGISGFHFVDEAASPKILRELSEEILKRKLTVSWWTNIRFEKAFTRELCTSMSQSGCIAVSGGIEVASNRLLKLMNKGVTVEQAAQSAYHLTQNNIMVHAYLMYGFPTQTIQETIDGLEIIRQMFAEKLIQSAFWHRYAMTVHSPSGINPMDFGAKLIETKKGSFANNERPFTDGQDIDLDMLGMGLRKATYNYMHEHCMDWSVVKWFEGKVPKSTLKADYIRKSYVNSVKL